MSYPTSPCKNCRDRSVTCHSTCSKYKEYRFDLDKFNEEVRKSKELHNPQYSFHDWYVYHCRNRRK